MNRVTTNCPTCAQAGEQGSCARHRCYCGHPECWACNRKSIAESIPKAYTRFIGGQIMAYIESQAAIKGLAA